MKSSDYIEAMNNMSVPEGLSERLCRRVLSAGAPGRRGRLPRRRTTAILVIAAALLLGTAAYAAGSGAISSWFTAEKGVYRRLPDEERCIKDCGFAPVLIDSFDNGFAFRDGRRLANLFMDEQGEPVESFGSFKFSYARGADTVSLYQLRADDAVTVGGEAAETVDEITIYCQSYMYMAIPEGYQLTAEEQAAADRGELRIAYLSGGGSAAPEPVSVRVAEWLDGGMHCLLQQIGGALSEAELVAMAKEVIALS